MQIIVLYHKPNIPIAIVEAKDGKHSIGYGMQQGIDYVEILDIPFVYSSNGDGFVEHDPLQTHGELEREISLEEFPSPDELWKRFQVQYCTQMHWSKKIGDRRWEGQRMTYDNE